MGSSSRRFAFIPALSWLAVSAFAQAPQSSSTGAVNELAAMRSENEAIREQLRRVEAQQETLLRLVSELQQRIDGAPPAPAAVPPSPTPAEPAMPPSAPPETPPQPAPSQAADPSGGRYEDGIVLVRTPESSRFPLLLKIWDVSQIRYTNTLLGAQTFTDHLGIVRPVTLRNDVSLNRNMIQFVGYVFDKRLQFNLITWASNSSAAIVAGGYVSFKFNKAIAAYAGYWGAPGTRSLTGTFPYFVQLDRTMADQFFRPGFTQGTWIDGEPWNGFHYEMFVGNGLNTLTIPTTKIDRHLVYSGSIWWEPLGTYGLSGRARGMFDDYQSRKKPSIRVGASYTKSREDRFSNLDEHNPENVALFNSDGVNTFATGAFAPGVTLNEAVYRMLAADAGVKWRGLAVNSQYFFRWLNKFIADGPLPLKSTFDHGFETEISKMVVPKRWELYGRTSFIFGQFRNSYEYAGGVKYYLVPNNHRVWLVGEALRVFRSPLSSVITPYNSGLTGWAPLVQWMFNF